MGIHLLQNLIDYAKTLAIGTVLLVTATKTALAIFLGQIFSKRFILILSLEEDTSGFKKPCLNSISYYMTLREPSNEAEACELLSSPDLAGVFVADASISRRSREKLLRRLVKYVKNGGTVVFGGSFSEHISFSRFHSFFKRGWGLRWKLGSYHRTKFQLNGSNYLAKMNPTLEKEYTVKALHVKSMLPDDAIYTPTEFSRIISEVWKPSLVSDLLESPAVFTSVGKGKLGFIGDINWEEDSTRIILAMFGFLGMPTWRLFKLMLLTYLAIRIFIELPAALDL